jgi:hypothetical protein
MRRVWTAALAAAGLAAVAAVAPAEATLEFGPKVLVTPGLGEPSVAIGPDDAIYVTTPLAGDAIARSTDGGATWVLLPLVDPLVGGDDEHLVVAPDNTVYLAGQWTALEQCQSVSVGPLGGSAWVTQPIACELSTIGRFFDRPWITLLSRPTGGYTVFNAFTDPCCADDDHNRQVVMRSEDQGLTWDTAGTITEEGYFPGYLLADDARGRLYASTTRGKDAVMVCGSTDRAVSWSCHDVAALGAGDNGLRHVFLAVDADGWLYTAWSDDVDGVEGLGRGQDIWFSSSSDGGVTWSPAQNLTPQPGTHVFPTIDAMGQGRVAVGWYATSKVANPNAMPADAAWRPQVAITDTGRSANPTWTTATVTEEPNHLGTLCTQGASCQSLATRSMLDFFMLKLDRLGRVNVAWTEDRVPREHTARGIYFARSR